MTRKGGGGEREVGDKGKKIRGAWENNKVPARSGESKRSLALAVALF